VVHIPVDGFYECTSDLNSVTFTLCSLINIHSFDEDDDILNYDRVVGIPREWDLNRVSDHIISLENAAVHNCFNIAEYSGYCLDKFL
jgi:hypothetical protein